VRLFLSHEHVYVVEVGLAHVPRAIRKHDAGKRVEVGVEPIGVGEAYLFLSVSTSMPAPWGPSASACAMCEQLVKRRVSRARSLSLCGMATVVVPCLGPPPIRPR
jgi:hypothetical protein